ncbi:MAG TPA: hypothetical protein DEQ87_20255, partial [Algoriphagus sp.]|uniref:hypothetical protein n=1 Tax=Algoriphagus sp. TaxID=1872435 RepID=UPI000EF0F7BF
FSPSIFKANSKLASSYHFLLLKIKDTSSKELAYSIRRRNQFIPPYPFFFSIGFSGFSLFFLFF